MISDNDVIFSIILPVYNVEQYLPKCLDSLINQTLKNIEFICVDDGSTDSSLKILKEYAQKDDRFVIVSQENQGQGTARNNGVKLSSGKYIMFVDPDDWIKIDTVEKLYNKFIETDAQVLQFDYISYVEDEDSYFEAQTIDNLKNKYDINIEHKSFFNWKDIKSCCFNLGMAVWSRAYSREFIVKNNVHCSAGRNSEDCLYTIMSILLADKISYLDKALYFYRIRIGSCVNSYSEKILGVFKILEEIETFLQNNNLLKELESEFSNFKIETLAFDMKICPKSCFNEYKKSSRKILSKEEYKKMLSLNHKTLSIWEKIFSIRNKCEFGLKYKTIMILGFKFEIKRS